MALIPELFFESTLTMNKNGIIKMLKLIIIFMSKDNNLYSKLIIWFFIILFILLVILVMNQFVKGMTWGLEDFLVAGGLLFGVTIVYEMLNQKKQLVNYKKALSIALGTNLVLIWSNLAVGIIGSENNPVNLIYFSIPIIFLSGAIISNFKASGLAKTLNIMAIVQISIPLGALIINHPQVNILGILLVLGLNFLFAFSFWFSASLFVKKID